MASHRRHWLHAGSTPRTTPPPPAPNTSRARPPSISAQFCPVSKRSGARKGRERGAVNLPLVQVNFGGEPLIVDFFALFLKALSAGTRSEGTFWSPRSFF